MLDIRSVKLDGTPKSKQEALDEMVSLMVKSGKINNAEEYRKQVYAREEESTTGIGEGIAIPHGRGESVDRPGLAAMLVKDGVDFDSLDDEPVTQKQIAGRLGISRSYVSRIEKRALEKMRVCLESGNV